MLKRYRSLKWQTVKRLMRETLDDRKNSIKESTISDVLQQYPCLNDPKCMTEEFKILKNRTNLKNLTMRLQRLVKNTEPGIEDLLKNLPQKLDHSSSGRIVFDDSESDIPATPIVLSNDGTYWVRCEEAQLCRTSCLKEAIQCWAFFFAIFQIEIPAELKPSVFLFIE